MKFNPRKFGTIIVLSSLLLISGLFTAFFQDSISKANANLKPIIVSLLHLDFGLVFPGEQLQKTFIVSYSGSGNGDYTIVEKYKPFDPIDSDYCQENYEDKERCYKYLCPYMDEYSEEGEGDVVNSASVGPDDLSDVWIVSLNTPAILGNVAQDHTGGIVTENGIYGCDLSFNVEEQICQNDVDVVLIMDRSGSMAWDSPSRLSRAKDAANSFLGNLGANDQSALVSYASGASTDKELDNNHIDDLPVFSTKVAVNALAAVGGTNIGEAIDFANQELGSNRVNPQAVRAAILLTDGRPTCPVIHPGYPICGYIEDAGDITYAEDKAAEADYKIFTIGLGSDVNEIMLQNIAAMTGAEYYFAPDGDDLEGIYDQISQELCQ